MFTLGVSDHVMIAHSIADPTFGPAQRLHGATYCIDVQIRAPQLNRHNVVMNIGLLRVTLRTILDQFDYFNLDEHPAFAGMISTTERVAEHVANRIAEQIGQLETDQQPAPGGTVNVILKESPVAYAGYERHL